MQSRTCGFTTGSFRPHVIDHCDYTRDRRQWRFYHRHEALERFNERGAEYVV